MIEYDEDHLASVLVANDYYFESSKALLMSAIISKQNEFLQVFYCYFRLSSVVMLEMEERNDCTIKVFTLQFFFKKVIQLAADEDYEDFIREVLFEWRVPPDNENILMVLLKFDLEEIA